MVEENQTPIRVLLYIITKMQTVIFFIDLIVHFINFEPSYSSLRKYNILMERRVILFCTVLSTSSTIWIFIRQEVYVCYLKITLSLTFEDFVMVLKKNVHNTPRLKIKIRGFITCCHRNGRKSPKCSRAVIDKAFFLFYLSQPYSNLLCSIVLPLSWSKKRMKNNSGTNNIIMAILRSIHKITMLIHECVRSL